MADDILTKDRSGANIAIAAKDMGSSVLLPRNMLTDAAGADINPALKSQLPTALGSAADAASLAVTQSTEDKARIGSLTETAPATDTASSGLNGRLQRIAQKLTALIAQIPASLGIKTAANSLSIAPASDAKFAGQLMGRGVYVIVTRPANTTPYTAGDVVGGMISIAGLATESSASGLINSISITYAVGTTPTGLATFRLHLYQEAPASNFADNASWDVVPLDWLDYLGFVDIGPMTDVGSVLFSQVDNVGKQFKVSSGSGTLYGYLQTLSAFTPASNSEVLRINIHGVTI